MLVRLLIGDDEKLEAAVHRLFTPFDSIAESVLINDIVLVETLWTLCRLYDFNRTTQIEVLNHLLSTLTFRFEDRDVVTRALFIASSADFSDCLITAKNVNLGCDMTATFDRVMNKLKDVQLVSA